MTYLGLLDAVDAADAFRARGLSTAIASIVADRSPSALPAGARVVVAESGEMEGSLGPIVDPVLRRDAGAVLAAGRSELRSYDAGADDLVPARVGRGNLDVFFELRPLPPHLVIVGAGHIAQPLAQMAKILEFQVTVVDDRARYANRLRFPDADEIAVGPYGETVAGLPIGASSCVVLVTRGHVHDQACLVEVLRSRAPYIGMIGSKRRVRTVLSHLRELGFDRAALRRVYAPIGIDIGSQTPAEIALAILAEIVNLRRGGRAPSLALRELRDA
ncbi:MAG TPA: XdhC/CoxI family protein [Chloroflexota bacterium]|nr:XdhC/CoxI family protein [Chloroflexota bacterium]